VARPLIFKDYVIVVYPVGLKLSRVSWLAMKFLVSYDKRKDYQNHSFNGLQSKQTLKKYLLSEFIVIFLLVPIFIYFGLINIPKMDILLLLSGCSFVILACDPWFNKKKLAGITCHPDTLKRIGIRYVIGGFILLSIFYMLSPQTFILIPFKKPLIWFNTSCDYLFLSVIPQELLYRAFLFHRYSTLFRGKRSPVVVSTLSFSFVHIVYGNVFALLLTLIGGYFFSTTYQKSHSIIITILEHFMYGILIFSSGSGEILSTE
jgi:uncharacterized protein